MMVACKAGGMARVVRRSEVIRSIACGYATVLRVVHGSQEKMQKQDDVAEIRYEMCSSTTGW